MRGRRHLCILKSLAIHPRPRTHGRLDLDLVVDMLKHQVFTLQSTYLLVQTIGAILPHLDRVIRPVTSDKLLRNLRLDNQRPTRTSNRVCLEVECSQWQE